jgi:nitrogen-specific signal transduction histidine kinase
MSIMETNEVLQGTDNALIIVRRDDLIEFANTYANRMIAGQPKATTKQEIEPPISQPDAILFMGKSRQTFYSLRKKGIIKPHLFGGRIYYFKSELIAAMK